MVGAAARSPSEVPPRHQPHRRSPGALGALLAAASRHGGCQFCSRGAALSKLGNIDVVVMSHGGGQAQELPGSRRLRQHEHVVRERGDYSGHHRRGNFGG